MHIVYDLNLIFFVRNNHTSEGRLFPKPSQTVKYFLLIRSPFSNEFLQNSTLHTHHSTNVPFISRARQTIFLDKKFSFPRTNFNPRRYFAAIRKRKIHPPTSLFNALRENESDKDVVASGRRNRKQTRAG